MHLPSISNLTKLNKIDFDWFWQRDKIEHGIVCEFDYQTDQIESNWTIWFCFLTEQIVDWTQIIASPLKKDWCVWWIHSHFSRTANYSFWQQMNIKQQLQPFQLVSCWYHVLNKTHWHTCMHFPVHFCYISKQKGSTLRTWK